MSTITTSQDATIQARAGHNTRSPTDKARACTNCVRAKAKCSFPSSVATKCERCRRMRKDCQPQPPPRNRKPVVRQNPSKVDRLEEKINGLVDFLKFAAESSAPSSINTKSREECIDAIPSKPVNISNHEASVLNPDYGINASPHSLALSTSSTPASVPTSLLTGIESFPGPNPENAQLYLRNFCTNFISHLPFLVIPPSVTVFQVQQERPILWLCIMTVASNCTNEQIALSRKVRGLFGKMAYIDGNRNLDLLLGILVLTAWDRHLGVDKPVFTSLVQFAISVLYELGLDKAPSTDMGFVLMRSVKGESNPTSQSSRLPTMEERRALLGCYLLSTVSSSSRKGQSLRWTAYFDDCLRVVQETKEFETDKILVQIVKFRLVSEKKIDTSVLGVAGQGFSETIPATFYVKSLKSELHECAAAIPSELIGNRILLLERYYTELHIYEIGFSQSSSIFIEQPNLRFECLFACLQATKLFLETLLSIEASQYLGLSALATAAIASCFTSLCRLATYEHSGWDRDMVHSTINMSFFFGEIEKRYAQVKEAVGIDPDNCCLDVDYFTTKASKLRSMRASWDALTLPVISAQELESFSMDFLEAWNW